MMDSLIVFGAKYLVGLVLLGAIVPFVQLNKESKSRFLGMAAVSGIVAFALTKLAGMAYFDPRPFTHGVHSLIPHEADNGFPSDHTGLSFTVACLVLAFSRMPGYVLLVMATLVAVCRVLSGVHSPIDVCAGALIGAAAVAVALGSAQLVSKFSSK